MSDSGCLCFVAERVTAAGVHTHTHVYTHTRSEVREGLHVSLQECIKGGGGGGGGGEGM